MLGVRFLILILALFSLMGCGNSKAAMAELAKMGVPYNEKAFIESAKQGNAAALGLFIDAGMNPETRTTDGQTALMVATLAEQTEAVKVLIAKGADVNAKDKFK